MPRGSPDTSRAEPFSVRLSSSALTERSVSAASSVPTKPGAQMLTLFCAGLGKMESGSAAAYAAALGSDASLTTQ
jgi:hypothetical protein